MGWRRSARRAAPRLLAVAVLLVLAGCRAESPVAPESLPAPAGPVTATPAAGMPAGTDICHYRDATGDWQLFSLPAAAAERHLAHHDDAVPGGTTPGGTSLDQDCVPVVVCPCFTTADIVTLFAPGEPDRSLTGYPTHSYDAFIHDLTSDWGGPWLVESLVNNDGGGDYWTCEQRILGSSDPPVVHLVISHEQHLACVQQVAAAQLDLGMDNP